MPIGVVGQLGPRTRQVDGSGACSGKMAEWIRMPFGMVSAIGRGIGVLDEGGDRQKGKGQFWGVNLGHPVVTNGAFVA